jgi:hypothetical protein
VPDVVQERSDAAGPGIDFMKLYFGRNVFEQINKLEFLTNFLKKFKSDIFRL